MHPLRFLKFSRNKVRHASSEKQGVNLGEIRLTSQRKIGTNLGETRLEIPRTKAHMSLDTKQRRDRR